MKYTRLKDLREDKDLRQKDIAQVISTSSNYYGDYENGKRPLPFDRAVELAKFYNVSLDYIAGRTNDKRGLTRSELSENETDLIKNFRSLSIERQSRILERIQMLIEEQETEKARIKEVG